MIPDSLTLPNSKNSLKEASLSLFLSAPLQKPERVRESFAKSQLATTFQNLTLLTQMTMEVAKTSGGTQSRHAEDTVGFRMEHFETNQLRYAIQAINEPGRTYVSLHELLYTDWREFKRTTLNYVADFAKLDPALFVVAMGINYWDEFRWNADEDAVKDLLNHQSRFLPNEIFESEQTDLVGSFQKTARIHERFELHISKAQRIISLKHSSVEEFDDSMAIVDISNSQKVADILDRLHQANKSMVQDMLKEEIQNRIGV